MPVAWPVTKRIKPVKKRFPCILDEPKTIGHYLEPLKDIASNPDRQRLLKEFFQETYVELINILPLCFFKRSTE